MKAAVVVFILSLASLAQGSVLALEYKSLEDDDFSHGEDVFYIACAEEKTKCGLLYVDALTRESKERVDSSLQNFSVINMSFGFQSPNNSVSPFAEGVQSQDSSIDPYKLYREQREVVDALFKENPNVLFTIAAGNGYEIGGLNTPGGVPLIAKYKLYPAYNEGENLLKVTALESDQVDFSSLEEQKIASYANYSVWAVDVATVVERNESGETIRGTSFTAPYAARLASKIREADPLLKPAEVKEILIKSSYVKNLDAALKATKDYLEQGSESLLYKAHYERKRTHREEALKELGDILLVKSGGILIPEVAYLCYDYYSRYKLSITESCLLAQEKILKVSPDRAAKIIELWALRSL